jgi:UDP-GlcNAc:undecaprenyl-phosphate GlcNAc-1-phosphate transferase
MFRRSPALNPLTVAALTCGAILGFMAFNFPTFRNRYLRTFMGDAGSTLLGFLVVWFALSLSQGKHRSLSPVAALWFVLMPLSDFFSCFVRRVVKGKMPLHAGREHFHYMLMRAGLSGRQVLAVLVAFAAFYAAVGVIGTSQKLPDWALFAPWITLLGLQHFIIRGLAVHLSHRRWRASKVVVQLPASVGAAHSYATPVSDNSIFRAPADLADASQRSSVFPFASNLFARSGNPARA